MTRIGKRFQLPAMYVGSWWSAGFVVTVVFLAMGDFGIPLWLVPVDILFALTVGLPTLLSLIVSTFVYEILVRLLGALPLSAFAVCFAMISLAVHTAVFFWLVRLARKRGTR